MKESKTDWMWVYENPKDAANMIDKLRAALDRYGLHDIDCKSLWHGTNQFRCSCGFCEVTE